MNRHEFKRLRDLEGKTIEADIRFEKDSSIAAVLTFRNVRISNDLGYALFLNGRYNARFKAIIYNVRVEDLGPICRVCVNGEAHGNVGRTHKHSLKTEECAKFGNIGKDVVPRPDLMGMSAREVFNDFCTRALIVHTGMFYDPEGI